MSRSKTHSVTLSVHRTHGSDPSVGAGEALTRGGETLSAILSGSAGPIVWKGSGTIRYLVTAGHVMGVRPSDSFQTPSPQDAKVPEQVFSPERECCPGHQSRSVWVYRSEPHDDVARTSANEEEQPNLGDGEGRGPIGSASMRRSSKLQPRPTGPTRSTTSASSASPMI